MPCYHYHKPSNNILKCASTREIYQDMFDQYIKYLNQNFAPRTTLFLICYKAPTTYTRLAAGRCSGISLCWSFCSAPVFAFQNYVRLSKDTFLLNNGELRLLINGKGRKERILQITTPELLQVVQTQPKAAGCPAAFARTADNRVLSFT